MGRRFFVEQLPVSTLKVHSTSFHGFEFPAHKELPQRFVFPVRVMIFVSAPCRNVRANDIRDVNGNGDLVTKGEGLYCPFFGINPFRVLRFAKLPFPLALVEIESIRNGYTACWARKRMFLPVFMPDLGSGDDSRFARDALCNM